MKSFFLTALCLSISLIANAQFGVNAKYVHTSQEWQFRGIDSPDPETPLVLFNNGWSVGVDYWFRLKNKRIEFLPELNLTRFSNTFPDNPFSSEANVYSFYFNTNLYLWDMNGDCDCPTFSKQGPDLKKGLFLQVSPGISYWDVSHGNEINSIIDGQDISFSIGGGIGFDIGLSDLITISPVFNVRYFPNVAIDSDIILTDVNGVPLEGVDSRISAAPLFFSGGLRLGIRLNP